MRRALAALLLLAGCVQAEKKPVEPKAQENQVVAGDLVSVRIPPRTPAPKPPLLVLLHGIGSHEHDLASLAPHLDPRFAIRSVRAPNPMGPGRNAWFQFTITPEGVRNIDAAQAEASRRALVRFIDRAVAEDGADPERVYLAGFSQGGIMTMAVALTEPGRVAGAVCMSGRILPQSGENRAPDASLKGLPILLVHGARDEVLPISNARASEALLSQLPVALTAREFDMAHEISPESLKVVSEWLTARLAAPRR